MSKRIGIYARVSTRNGQTVENQLRQLNEVADRMGWSIVAVWTDEGVSGSKGRDQRPGFDQMITAINRREVDLVAAWSVDRLGRSLQDLIGFLADLQAKGCDLYLHQQGIDTSTPSGRMLFQMLSVFAEFEREMIRERVVAGLERTKSKGTRLGRPKLDYSVRRKIEIAMRKGKGIRPTARALGVSTTTVMKIKAEMDDLTQSA
ncbi:recombinase family protein [Thalassospira sp.]|uniref:recombinase family protein n=1 Tax=Thalassospira sp. TaxID=1912094 RepID=UPI000C4A301D|nr:recombinase family protein [Thalassospira sp.]MBA07048.1 resolvase [Thalassospira sp.]HBS25226.1 resolvase [Thalassospira sp.]|tara:strand:+ start:139 stop:750 length:612 start_codon:yes stop_codon:yes gene_type:complete